MAGSLGLVEGPWIDNQLIASADERLSLMIVNYAMHGTVLG